MKTKRSIPLTSLALPLLALLLSLTTVAAAQPGFISTVAGTGTSGFNGDGILATTAHLAFPAGVFVDGSGNLFIADFRNERVRRVDGATGLISTVAGTGVAGFNGDGILATTAQLKRPESVFVDGSGNLFITDHLNHRVRRVDFATGLISTVAGTGVFGFNGDGILATTAQLNQPESVFVDGSGNLFIADFRNERVRRVDFATGLISTVAGTGVAGFNGDGILATTAQLNTPHGVFVDGSGNLFIPEFYNQRVRRVDGSTGLISTVAGTGVAGFNGDGILAATAQLGFPTGVFVDGSRNLFIADAFNHRVRKVEATAINVEGVVDELIDNIIALNLGKGLGTALVTQLENALASFERGNENITVYKLNAFIHLVEARRGKALSDAEADDLIAHVQAIIDTINSGGAAKANLLASEAVAVPDQYALQSNYPNPFNPATTIRFSLPEASPVKLVVFDVLGRQVRVLVDGVREAGIHEVLFEAGGLPSGTYLYRLETRQGSFVQMMHLVK